MISIDQERSFTSATSRHTGFQNLMRQRVNEILLVSSLYDSFILAQDGQIEELMLSEFMQLNLYHSPGLTRVAKASEALYMAKSDPRYNLIIATANMADMNATEFARRAREQGVYAPIVLLAFDNKELREILDRGYHTAYDQIFLWQGNFRILLALVKHFEDKWNVEHDTKVMGVQAVLMVEDNIRFYSSYLPMAYAELMRQSQSLLEEGMNLAHKILRMRARPKILLTDNFEEAWSYYRKYENNILGVITDIEYLRQGVKDPEAGPRLVKLIRQRREDIPILLQSFEQKTAEVARELNVDFVRKNSPTLMHDLRKFMTQNFSFGPFVFRNREGKAIAEASDLRSLEKQIKKVPEESLLFHAERDHFSNWLKARTEFRLAERLKPRKVNDYPSVSALRMDLVSSLRDFRRERSRGLVADFSADQFDPASSFARIGGGSMGGKARGLAFLAHLIDRFELRNRYEGVLISTPATAVLGTDVFERFMEQNDLWDYALQTEDDEEIRKQFLAAKFPRKEEQKLTELLEVMTYPLAVRSSGLLEDSHYQPFAGIYSTFMLPNNRKRLKQRFDSLIRAIKLIYASTFSKTSRAYIRATPYRLEEERMAVIIQRLVGRPHGDRFYPDFAGVSRSYNFYPTPPATSAEGIAHVALGLGGYVVDGGEGVRFCPKYPRHIPQFGTLEDSLDHSQKRFFALHIPEQGEVDSNNLDVLVREYSLQHAEKDDVLHLVASTYSAENNAIYDGIRRNGPRVVTFAPVLKHNQFPLAKILEEFLELGQRGLNRPVELEFAVNAGGNKDEREFQLLQMRPLVLNRELANLRIDNVAQEKLICRTPSVLGIGRVDDIRDIVFVDKRSFQRAHSQQVAEEVGRINSRLVQQDRPYLLIGLGRWGSTDPWLGIPVGWEQISGARVIVETGFDDIKVQPSEGAHFFHNITSLGIGYFTVNPDQGQGLLDWDWIYEQPSIPNGEFVRHIELEETVPVLMNGHKNIGVILKPGSDVDRRS